MYQVGTKAGNTNTERQGTGLATILQGDSAVDAYGRMAILSEGRRKAADEAAKAAKKDALAKLTAFQPEYFYKHKQEIQPLIEAHIAKGAEFLARNKDPWTSGDPDAVEWQKEHQRITAMAANSKQMMEEYTKFRQDIDGKNPDDFTAASLQDNLAWFERPLEQTLQDGVLRPTLDKKTEWSDAFSFVGKAMQTWQTDKKDPSDLEINDFVTSMLADPANQKYVASYAKKYNQLSPDEQKALSVRAKDSLREPVQQMAFEDAKRWQKGQEPFNLFDELKKGATAAESGLDYEEGGNDEYSYKRPKKGSVEKSASAIASDLFNSRPDWMTTFDRSGDLPRGDEETDASYAARVKGYMTGLIKERMKVDTRFQRSAEGGKQQKLIQTRDVFIRDVRSDDPVLAQAAVNILKGTSVVNNLDIDTAVIGNFSGQGRELALELTTNLSLDEVKSQFAWYGTEEQAPAVEEGRQGHKTVYIPLGKESVANQTLAKLYDNYVKETGSYYDPALSERSVKTAMGTKIIVPKTASARKVNAGAKQRAPLDHLFN